MKFRTVGRHVKESFKSLYRNGWMTFAAASAVTVTLILVSVFFSILINMNKLASDVENDVQINVHVSLSATDKQEDELKANIEKVSGVEKVTFSSKDEQLNKLVGAYGKNFELFKQDNPLHDVFVVQAKNPEQTKTVASKIEKLKHVEDAEYGEKTVDNLFNTLKWARYAGIVLSIGLLLTAMFLISNTIKIAIFSRRREIEIMKLVGATNWFIRWPFVLEGAWLGLIGSIIPVILTFVGYINTYNLVNPKLATTSLSLLPPTPFAYQLSALIILIGVLIGIWGSAISIRRFLKV
ncbi:cell division ABC transporter permease [Listeria floridensis FSL S10-1187]|uniref:Cell division protein FtsX n=1 Tax=Listeria floridensis FSL S10-1187 TaxID=1265817 RepID=A0ABN0RBH8_9LIST|nr:permease-like cell division protein FtsX [Listeria floridensis]EUJ25566.1 cell division ABC transporter permease [Listeria floridensis FSL S10-1187]